jgi:hypothetical protein
MACYYQGCLGKGKTKEHIPPKAFFPEDQRNALLTVRSCELHNGAKSKDDLYVLAQICLNTSPSNRSREVFLDRVVPQLEFNGEALRKMLASDAIPLPGGAIAYKVDEARVDKFFSALSYGIIFKACGQRLPSDYTTWHIYHNLYQPNESPQAQSLKQGLLHSYSGEPPECLQFGNVKTLNASIYSAKIFGLTGFQSSITVVHEFYGVFRVTSMLSKQY